MPPKMKTILHNNDTFERIGIKGIKTTIGKPTRHRKTKNNKTAAKTFLPIKLYCSEIKLCADLHEGIC